MKNKFAILTIVLSLALFGCIEKTGAVVESSDIPSVDAGPSLQATISVQPTVKSTTAPLASPSPAASVAPSVASSPSPSPLPVSSPNPSPTPSSSSSPSPSPTPTPTVIPSPSPSPSPIISPSPTAQPTLSLLGYGECASLFKVFSFIPYFNGITVRNCSLITNETGSMAVTKWNTSEILNGQENHITYSFSTEANYLWNIRCYYGDSGYFEAPDSNIARVDMTPPGVVGNILESNIGQDYVFLMWAPAVDPSPNPSGMWYRTRYQCAGNNQIYSLAVSNYFTFSGLSPAGANCSFGVQAEDYCNNQGEWKEVFSVILPVPSPSPSPTPSASPLPSPSPSPSPFP
ncbi:Uncharacterised protein [Candidatus Norongarragalina meridionalis]|nr:Uncharacterised protein [Candidatus Norongarragalina meridionalis]